MLKKKIIVVTLLAGMLLTSYNIYANAIDSNSNNKGRNNVVTSNKDNTKAISEDKKFTPKVKREEITDKDKIKNNFPIKEEKPTVELGELKEVSVVATQDTYNPDIPNYTTNSYRIITQYKAPGKELIIVQGEAAEGDEASLSGIINKTGETKVKGVNAVICESKGGYTQVTFIKDKKFYNVMGCNIDKTNLVKIAESLK